MKTMAQVVALLCLALSLVACDMTDPPLDVGGGGGGGEGELIINEFLASNAAAQMDEHGDFDDWLEVYNSGNTTINLVGYYFSDNIDDPTQYQIPASAGAAADVPAGGFLIIWCDNQPEQGGLHANFKLSAGGESIIVSAPDGSLVESLTYAAQSTDISYGRLPDGGTEWGFIQPTTGGGPNVGGGTNVRPVIGLTRLDPLEPDVDQDVTLYAVANDNVGVAEIALHYSVSGGDEVVVIMAPTKLTYSGVIPAQAAGAVVSYYVVATDDEGATGSLPFNAPEVVFSYVIPGGAVAPDLFINEFIASNDFGATDDFGDTDDWIEIFNAGDTAVDIGGMYLTDTLASPTMWQVPTDDAAATTIPSGGYLVIWCDNEVIQGTLHSNFKLGAGGEAIGFYTSGGIEIDSLTYPAQTTDVSQARMPDGSANWDFLTVPTPGATNAALFINEFIASNAAGAVDEVGNPGDWLEIYNAGETAVDVGGMYLTADEFVPNAWMIPTDDAAATTIAAGGFLVIWCDATVGVGTLHANFKLGKSGSYVGLFTAAGANVDGFTYLAQETDISEARVPDGSANWANLVTPTPGATNGTLKGGW